jgi:hypothetical protein
MDRFQPKVLILFCLSLALFTGCTTEEERIDSSQDYLTVQAEAIESNQDEPFINEEYTHSFSDWVEISAPGWGIEGTEERVCGYCGERQVQAIPPYTYGLEINQDGVVVSRGSVTEDVIIIPSTISPTDSAPVTAIGEHAFNTLRGGVHRDGDLVKVRIPESVTTIGRTAFSGNMLTSVRIPSNVTVIEQQVFRSNLLTSVIIPDGVTIIEEGAFSGNRLTSVTIPNTVTIIGWDAFTWNRLTSVVIPDSVTVIGFNAFIHNEISSLTIGNSVVDIWPGAFAANRLTSVIIPSSVTTLGHTAFSAWNNGIDSITMPDNVTIMDMETFLRRPLVCITMPAADDIEFFWQMGIFDSRPTPQDAAFQVFYNNNGRLAGVYSFNGNEWSFSP